MLIFSPETKDFLLRTKFEVSIRFEDGYRHTRTRDVFNEVKYFSDASSLYPQLCPREEGGEYSYSLSFGKSGKYHPTAWGYYTPVMLARDISILKSRLQFDPFNFYKKSPEKYFGQLVDNVLIGDGFALSTNFLEKEIYNIVLQSKKDFIDATLGKYYLKEKILPGTAHIKCIGKNNR